MKNVNKQHQTLFLSASELAQLIVREGIPQVLGGLLNAIEADFKRWPQFDKSARLANHSADGVIELMPIADAQTFTFKYVNGHPKNTDLGLSTVMAFGVLADVATGMPRLISELTLTTALRTAATSVMAARLLAKPGSRSMALIGNGAQSEFQALAFYHLMGIDRLHLFDIESQATAKLINNLKSHSDTAHLQVRGFESAALAVKGVDIVTTITADKTNAAILTQAMIEPGMHLNAVGGDCPGKTEIDAAVLNKASVFVEFEPQTRIEGDLQQMPADFKVTELWTLLAQTSDKPVSGRTSAQQITMFDSVGFALEDFSALRYVRALAIKNGAGQSIDLIPRLSDPKDLFQMISAPQSEVVQTELASINLLNILPPTSLLARSTNWAERLQTPLTHEVD
jgi:ornithine cyclodeaminase